MTNKNTKQLPKDWETFELDRACSVNYGTRVVRKRDGGTKYPVYGGGGATFFMNEYNRENQLTIARFAMSEQCTRFVKGKFFLNDSGLTITPIDSKKIYQKFLDYQILSLNNHIYFLARGTAQKNLDVPAFRKMKVSYPDSIEEQKQIVKILDEVFESISKSKEAAEENLENAMELFESCLEGVFSNPGKDWKEKKLGEVCKFVRGPFGGSLKKGIFKESGYAVYEQRHAIYNRFDNVRYFIDEDKFNEMKRFELFPNDLIMSCSGTMGKIAIVPSDIQRGIINQALLKLSPSRDLVNTYLKSWMESKNFQEKLKEFSQGAAIKNVASVKILKEIKMPLSPLSEQKTIVSKLDALSKEIKELETIYSQKVKNLDELKKSILQKAFSGELTK